VVEVTMDDFCWNGWWERGAEDIAELRNTVVFSTTAIHLSGMLSWSTKRRGMTRGGCVPRGQRSPESSDCAKKMSLHLFLCGP
jgi:hypothetical protein